MHPPAVRWLLAVSRNGAKRIHAHTTNSDPVSPPMRAATPVTAVVLMVVVVVVLAGTVAVFTLG
ncbi:hypothetical protein PNP85_02465, partial [Halobacterium salinarum]|uniref:archaellin/type IV pilin N-terminal domain-containing protein n=1 Tax=Halobacterium salinarum TaxID=2242 RepID=UPI00256E0608|nr:hypothetical protein [Halobacterium salinarum]